MPVLREYSVLIMDGAVKLYRRERSRKWQAAFQIDGQYIWISTGKSDLDEAKQAASDSYLEYKFRQKNDVPVVSKRFSDVAKLCISEMKKQLESGVGKKVYRDYVIVLEKYLIPFFGKMHVTSITYETLQKFARWREQQMGKEPKASTLNTHNSALNRVFDESVARGFMNKTHVPTLINKGRDSERRPDFTQEEYASMIRKLPHWINKTQHPKSVHMRELLRDYVLIMANTGMRHGTEAQNLKWQHITQFEDNGQSYLEMSVSGKTGRRDIICRSGTINYLKRIHERSEDIKHLEFEELLKQRLDLPVFRLRDGTVTNALHQTFRNFLRENELLICPRTGQARTLYSLRHTYATFALLKDGMDIHTLAIQMGTSIQMIERHYSHLENKLSVSIKQVRRLLEPQVQKAARKRTQSLAKYPVATKPVLRTLHEHLLVWNAKQQNPSAHDSALADIAGISVNEVVDGETIAELRAEYLPTRDLERVIKRRKQLVVQRHLRIAEQYIGDVVLGEFPKRKAR